MKSVLLVLGALMLTGCGAVATSCPVPALPEAVKVKQIMVGSHGCKLYPLITPEGGTELWEICRLDQQYRVRPEEIGYK